LHEIDFGTSSSEPLVREGVAEPMGVDMLDACLRGATADHVGNAIHCHRPTRAT
jgi:hypothetical protein